MKGVYKNFISMIVILSASSLSGCGGGGGSGDSIGNFSSSSASSSSSSSSSASSVAATFYIPGSSSTGLFVIPSNNPGIAPTYAYTGGFQELGVIEKKTYAVNGYLSSYSPYSLIYLSLDGSQQVHFSAIPLGNASVPAAPRQLSNFSTSTGNAAQFSGYCYLILSQGNLTNPDSAFVLRQDGGGTACGDSDDVVTMIRYTDTSSAAPTILPIHSINSLGFIYDTTGQVGGAVMLDSSTHNLVFMNGLTFTSPTTLVSNVTAYGVLAHDDQFESLGVGAVFLSVTTSSGANAIYRVDSNGGTTNVYSAVGTIGTSVNDSTHLYFIDADSMNSTINIMQESFSGGMPLKLYSFSYSSGDSVTLVGSNEATLTYELVSNSGGMNSYSIYNIPVGVSSLSANLMVTSPSTHLFPYFVASPDRAMSAVVIDGLDINFDGLGHEQYSSQLLQTDGTQLQPLLTNYYFFNAATLFSGSLLQLRNMTDNNGFYGGGTLYDVNMTTGVATQFSVPSAGPFTLPGDSTCLLKGRGISNKLGVVNTNCANSMSGSGGTTRGFIYDTTQHTITPVNLTGTDSSLYVPSIL